LEPREHRVIPRDAVLRLQDPAVLVREVEQLGWYAAALKRGEGRYALSICESIVFGAVDYEGWRLPVRNIPRGREPIVEFGVFPRRALVFPFWEPELFGREII
jgi:hypothetical protein